MRSPYQSGDACLERGCGDRPRNPINQASAREKHQRWNRRDRQRVREIRRLIHVDLEELHTPQYSADSVSSVGASVRQGPHQGAKKSTTTGITLSRTSHSNEAEVTDFTLDIFEAPYWPATPRDQCRFVCVRRAHTRAASHTQTPPPVALLKQQRLSHCWALSPCSRACGPKASPCHRCR